MKLDNPLILKLLEKLHHLSCAHKTIHLCWIPSHIGIRGNEAADMAAKESLNLDITASQVPYTDLKCHINHFISNKWQEHWSSCPDNKLFKIKPTLGESPPGFRNSRKEEVVLSRLRIGHAYFSHSYILRQQDPPECTACQDIYSIRQLQQCLTKIQKWALENGFKFSKIKTQCIHLVCQLRGFHNDPVLKLDGVEIPVVDQYKF